MASWSWGLSGNLNISANTNIILPKSNWNANSTSDPLSSSILNNSLMNSSGLLAMPYTGIFMFLFSIDTNEFLYPGSGSITISYTQMSTNVSYTLGTVQISSPKGQWSIKQAVQAFKGDTITIQWNLSSAFQINLSTVLSNNAILLQDASNNTLPLFWQGPINTVPQYVSIAPRFFSSFGTLINSNGKLTFYLTTNGLANGIPLFPNGLGTVMFTARSAQNNSTSVSAPVATEDSRAADNTWVTTAVQVSNVSAILLGGSTAGLTVAPVGTLVFVLVFGW